MPALATTARIDTVLGNTRMLLLTFGAIADADTYATGLSTIEQAHAQITDAAAAADALTITAIASGTLTFGVAGTISGAYVLVFGR